MPNGAAACMSRSVRSATHAEAGHGAGGGSPAPWRGLGRLHRRGARGARRRADRPPAPRRRPAARARRRGSRRGTRRRQLGQRPRPLDRGRTGLAPHGRPGGRARARDLLRRPGALRRAGRPGRGHGPQGDRLDAGRLARSRGDPGRALAGVPRRPLPAARDGDGAGPQRHGGPGLPDRQAPGVPVPPRGGRPGAQALAGRGRGQGGGAGGARSRPVPGRHHPRGAGRAGAGGPAGRRRAAPLDNPRQRRTQPAVTELPAVTITLYVIRTRCLAAPAARGSRLDEVRDGPSAHQGGQGQGRRLRARSRQHQPQHLPLGTRRSAGATAPRSQLYYCGAFGIPFGQFGTWPPAAMVDPGPGEGAAPAYRGLSSPDLVAPGGGASAIRQEVLMAAHEGSEHAERVEQRGIGEATLEQFRADVTSLSGQYLTGETYGLFTEMRRVRNRILEALGRRQWPRDAAELYLLAGCLTALMAAAATNLGYPQAAEELTRAGWAYASIIDHRPLMARLRLCAAYAAYWNGRPEQSAGLVRGGLGYLADGENAAQLNLFGGLAAARAGDAAGARQAIAAARAARDRDHHDELLEIGGEFGFSRATQAYYAGFVLSEAGAVKAAAAELEVATSMYAAGPGPGEQHSRRCRMLAHTDLAIARLRAGALDAAIVALEPVLVLPPGERTAVQGQRVSAARAELAQP